MTNKEQEIGKRIKGLVDNFYKTPIGELPKEHFWIDRNSHLCCGQFHTNIKVDITEALSLLKKEHEKELDDTIETFDIYIKDLINKYKKEVKELKDFIKGDCVTRDEANKSIHEAIQVIKKKCKAQKDEIFNDPV